MKIFLKSDARGGVKEVTTDDVILLMLKPLNKYIILPYGENSQDIVIVEYGETNEKGRKAHV